MYDSIIYNARIIDGTGAPWYSADVAISEGLIAAIGKLASMQAHREIDAKDYILCPGFIDVHSHSDATLLINPRAESSIRQGVTTECTGNCGASLFPVNEKNYAQVLDHFTSFVPEYDVNWTSLAELKSRYEGQGISVNIVPLVGHSTVRTAVKGANVGPTSKDEQAQIALLVEQAMMEGARGFSTGLEYPPGSASDMEELIALVKPLRKFSGIYVSHIRNRDIRFLEAVQEALEIGRKAGVAVQLSHNVAKIGGPEGNMAKVLKTIERARRNGLDVAFDALVYLGGQAPVVGSLPPWTFEGGPEETLKRLTDPETRKKIKEYEYPMWRIIKLGMWEKVRLASSKASPQLVGKTFAEIALEQKKDPYDVLFDLMLVEGVGFFDLMWEGEIFSPEDCDMGLKHPLSHFGGDGRTLAPYGPLSQAIYPNIYSWVAYLLRHHVRERGFMKLEEAIHKLTAVSANRLGLFDRGVIRKGLAADLVIFDPETVHDRATPKDPHRYPEGIQYVFVNGTLTIENGDHTGALAGKLLTWTN